jgi:hypothetical protein
MKRKASLSGQELRKALERHWFRFPKAKRKPHGTVCVEQDPDKPRKAIALTSV